MHRPEVEVLYFESCPNYRKTLSDIERVVAELGVETDVRLVEVADADAAIEKHFLGSPTVRIDGHDVEPGADERHDYVFACRVYRGARGLAGQPEEGWIRESLKLAAG
jgi:hypothetical protein